MGNDFLFLLIFVIGNSMTNAKVSRGSMMTKRLNSTVVAGKLKSSF